MMHLIKRVIFQMLLLCSCTGITCCLAVLGVYCDPHIHMQSWYLHRLRPNRKELNVIQETANISDNTTKVFGNYKIWSNNTYLENDFANDSHILFPFDENVTEVWGKEIMEFNEDKKILTPTVLLSMVLFLYNIGLGSVPYVLMSELFSVNVSCNFFVYYHQPEYVHS